MPRVRGDRVANQSWLEDNDSQLPESLIPSMSQTSSSSAKSRNDDDGTQLPGRDVEEFTVYTNAGNRPPAPEGTVEEKAKLTLSRIEERLPGPQPPYVLDGLLRRTCLAVVTGLGRKSQPDVVKLLVIQGNIELVMIDGEQWLRRTEPDGSKSDKPVGEVDGSKSDKPVGEEDG